MRETEVEVLEYITGIPPTMPEAPQLAQYALDLLSQALLLIEHEHLPSKEKTLKQ